MTWFPALNRAHQWCAYAAGVFDACESREHADEVCHLRNHRCDPLYEQHEDEALADLAQNSDPRAGAPTDS